MAINLTKNSNLDKKLQLEHTPITKKSIVLLQMLEKYLIGFG